MFLFFYQLRKTISTTVCVSPTFGNKLSFMWSFSVLSPYNASVMFAKNIASQSIFKFQNVWRIMQASNLSYYTKFFLNGS